MGRASSKEKDASARTRPESHPLEGLRRLDPETQAFIDFESDRQIRKIILIASESICPPAVREALASEFTNIYAEGYPSTRMRRHERDEVMDVSRHLSFFRRYSDRRYYKGAEYANFVESLTVRRLADLFATKNIPAEEIYANVQPLSGAAANNAVYDAFVEPGGVVMGMSLTHGGHLTHGSPYNRSGKHFQIVPYRADPKTGDVDFDELRKKALEVRPRMIIAGYSAYPWDIDWKSFREVCDAVPGGAILLADIAHTAGLVAGGVCANPLPYADVVTFTTHKTMCGPRGAVILTKVPDHARRVDVAVFPGEQGGPHINNIAAKAVCFRIAQTEGFRTLQQRIAENARTLCKAFQDRGYKIAYGGTNTHLFLIELSELKTKGEVGLNSEIAARCLDIAGITCNKNALPGDRSALNPSGLRFGTTFVSQRGMGPTEMEKIAELVDRVLKNSHSFTVIGNRGPLGRAKVPFGVIDEVAREAEELQAAFVQESEMPVLGYPHFPYRDRPAEASGSTKTPGPEEEDRAVRERAVICDLTGRGILQVSGERAQAFLQGLLTCDLSGIEVGGACRGFLLDAEGREMADVSVVHTERNEMGRSNYLITLHNGEVEEIKRWLRAHSDGYVLFEPSEIYAKIEGPVVIADARTGPSPLVRLGLFGSKAADAASAVDPTLRDLPPLSLRKVKGSEAEGVVLRDGPTGIDGFEFLVPAGAEEDFRSLLLANGGLLPAASDVVDRLSTSKVGAAGDRRTGESIYRADGESRISLSKPYFIGQTRLLDSLKPESSKKEFSYAETEGPLKRTALYKNHLELTKPRYMIPFAGWEMPVQYTSILEEHRAVREGAGLFDVAHMGVLEVSGEGATAFLNVVTTNYLTPLRTGHCQYNYVLDPYGTVMDDIIAYRLELERYMIIVNAANQEKIKAWFDAVNSREFLIDPDYPIREVGRPVRIRDLKDPASGSDRRVDMALQGPKSLEVLLRISDSAEDRTCLHCLHRSQFGTVRLAGVEAIVSRSGYTGEPFGYEIYAFPPDTPDIWSAILEAGKNLGVKPAGLGARDSTRTQAGFPLYGHELSGEHDITPLEAGYGAFVKRHKPFFCGKAAILRREAGRTMQVVRFRVESTGGRMVKPESPVVDSAGRAIGYVTSCAKVGKDQVGLAWVQKAFKSPGTKMGVFALPRAEKIPEGKSILDLSVGDRVTLHDEAVVISRFWKPG
ncbi:MAG: serine hydroxymethyltransferase [Planctomycetota bacterium]|nr:serine hydroxymethyltransferase [Planctomycetota bacterium]